MKKIRTRLDQPLITIIMPVFNAEKYVVDAIQSICVQTYKNFELLIIDDASSDDSYNVIKSISDSRLKIFKNDINKGYLRSVNFLFTQARGEFVTFQDSDDWSEPQRLEVQLAAFARDTDLMFCGSQCVYYKKGKKSYRSNFPLSHDDVVNCLESGDTVNLCGASVMFKRKLLECYQGYREFFDRIGAEDLDLFWRMLIKNKFMNLPDYLYNYRSTADSITRKLNLNPLKYHSTQIALLAYWQCKLIGGDVLNNDNLTAKLVSNIQESYCQDETLIYRRAAINQLAFGKLAAYLWCIKESFSRKGLNFKNLKLILVWLPLFIFLYLSPKRFQRKIVKNNNLQFLKTKGVDVKSQTYEFHDD